MMPEDYSKITSENIAKMTAANTVSDSYQKLTPESNWAQSAYGAHTPQSYLASGGGGGGGGGGVGGCQPPEYPQMQHGYPNQTNAAVVGKYWT